MLLSANSKSFGHDYENEAVNSGLNNDGSKQTLLFTQSRIHLSKLGSVF